MARFKISSKKRDNSHPAVKVALRRWLLKHFVAPAVLDVYGGGGMMFDRVWRTGASKYRFTDGDAIEWLNNATDLSEDVFDIDPYASPFEALSLICERATKERIGVVCTDGMLRRVAMMRTHIPDFICRVCGWPERDLSLMAGIYHQYPAFLRHVLMSIAPRWEIERLAVQYGRGTWRQATVYFAAILRKRPVAAMATGFNEG